MNKGRVSFPSGKSSAASLKLCRQLEETAQRVFDQVRLETGVFQTAACLIQGKNVLFINTSQPLDERIEALSKAITSHLQHSDTQRFSHGLNNVYLKPIVRMQLEKCVKSTFNE